jgi:FMN-dependent NADH-azoreductase
MKLLNIEVSPNGENSCSRQVSRHLLEKFKKDIPGISITTRDLDAQPIPHLTGAVVGAAFTRPDARTPDQQEAIKFSDELVDELLAADAVVISTPMWNFGLPSVLKAWVDHIVRVGRTFGFSSEEFKGLVPRKKIYVVVSSGSVFSKGAYAVHDQFVPSIRSIFEFIGLTEVEIIRVEGTLNPATLADVISAAKANIDSMKLL